MPDEPAGTYQVWHKQQEGYAHVANVECGNLMAAMVATLGWETKAPKLTRMVTSLVEGARGITFGDVIVNPEGKAYELHNDKRLGAGFKEVEFSQPEPPTPRAIFAEIMRDITNPPGFPGQEPEQKALRDILSGAGESGKQNKQTLKEASDRAMSRAQVKDEHER